MNFFTSVYEIVKKIPEGKVASYGQVAASLGNPKMARQVGWALHVNPYPTIIPCHRIVTKQGRVAESFAFGGGDRQRELLKKEGVKFDKNGNVQREYFIHTVHLNSIS